MAFEWLLREGRINRMVMPHRVITGPMERSMANRDGTLNQTYIDYLVERARNHASLMMLESTYVDLRGIGHLFQVGCHDDHVVPGLRRAAEAVHAEHGKLGIELYIGGRQTPSYMSQRQPIAPSVVTCDVLDPMSIPREMSSDDIAEVIEKFAAAARRVVAAGLDMIHLHGAHGYLLGAFLSPFSNKRTDSYGGSLENRARFPLEVLAAVREVVGAEFPLGYRLSADEYVEGGLTVGETARFASFLADAGIDLIDVSGGVYESAHMIIQGPEAPKGGFVENARAIKDVVGDRVPVSVGQRLSDPHFANEVLRREGLDYVTLSRAFHADAAYVQKLQQGHVDEIIPCIACHHCTNLLEANRVARCAANPSTGMERRRRIRSVSHGRKVVVVGGGPAGLQAARILAAEGHAVSLFEKGDELGGQMRYSSKIAADYGELIAYLGRQMVKLGVDVRLGTAADVDLVVNQAADAIVIATGAGPGPRFAPLIGRPRVLNLFTALDRPEEEWESRVVIVGGDSESCFLSLYLAGRGADVDIVEPKEHFAEDKMSPGKDLLMMTVRQMPTITLRAETTVEEIGEEYVVTQSRGDFERIEGVGSVVIGGRVADATLYEDIMEFNPELEIYRVGDAVEPRDVYQASHEAADAAEMIRLRGRAGVEVGV